MIQRIQSLWLALAAIVAGALFFIPMGEFNSIENGHFIKFFICNIIDKMPGESAFPKYYTLPLIIMNLAMVILPIYVMFRFKKREHQLFMVRLSIFVEIAFIAMLFLFYWSKIEAVAGVNGEVKIGIFLPIIECILLFLAMNGIKKDIDLVRSVDRIR